VWLDSLNRRPAQTNLETLDDLSARHRTLNYEYERLGKALASSKVAQGRMETDVNGWKIRVAELEKRLVAEETQTKELREEVNRGRKAVEAVRIAAGVSGYEFRDQPRNGRTQPGRVFEIWTLWSGPQLMRCSTKQRRTRSSLKQPRRGWLGSARRTCRADNKDCASSIR
jgi:hypothetical protein